VETDLSPNFSESEKAPNKNTTAQKRGSDDGIAGT